MTTTPSIACIGIIGKYVIHPPNAPDSTRNRLTILQDNPLHIALFPPHIGSPNAFIEFSFLLYTSLDVFDQRSRDRNRVDQDLGLLQIVDERLSIWGWETGTGVRFAIIVDIWGNEGGVRAGKGVGKGVGEGEVRGVGFLSHILVSFLRTTKNQAGALLYVRTD